MLLSIAHQHIMNWFQVFSSRKKKIKIKEWYQIWNKSLCLLFLSNFYFLPNDSPSKTVKYFLFHLKSSFRSWDIYSDFSNFFCSFLHFPDSKEKMEG